MKVTVDTNVLVRAIVRDHAGQAREAAKILRQAELIAVAVPCLCEFVWVLRKVYVFSLNDIAAALEALFQARNVVVNRPAVEAGLAMLQAGGDFADGAIAYEGRWLGGEVFATFDRRAVALLVQHGHDAVLADGG